MSHLTCQRKIPEEIVTKFKKVYFRRISKGGELQMNLVKENNIGNNRDPLSSLTTNPKVLILENEAIIAEDLRRRLELMGCQVVGVTASGRVAIDLAKENPPDILLLDLDVKGDLNGAETAVILQGYFEQPMPVIFVTAFSDKEFPVIHAPESYLYVKKPFTDEDLLKSLNKAIQLRSTKKT
jgi:CheY-like chemotaxis protein